MLANRLRAIGGVHRPENGAHMALYRTVGDPQSSCDHLVGCAFGEEIQYFQLPCGEPRCPGQPCCRQRLLPPCRRHRRYFGTGSTSGFTPRVRNVWPAGKDDAGGPQQIFSASGLADVAPGTQVKRADRVFPTYRVRDYQHGYRRAAAPKFAQRHSALAGRKPDVSQDQGDVRVTFRGTTRMCPIARVHKNRLRTQWPKD